MAQSGLSDPSTTDRTYVINRTSRYFEGNPLEKNMKFLLNSINRKLMLKSVPVEMMALNWEDLDNVCRRSHN
jgi:hypothetical protein